MLNPTIKRFLFRDGLFPLDTFPFPPSLPLASSLEPDQLFRSALMPFCKDRQKVRIRDMFHNILILKGPLTNSQITPSLIEGHAEFSLVYPLMLCLIKNAFSSYWKFTIFNCGFIVNELSLYHELNIFNICILQPDILNFDYLIKFIDWNILEIELQIYWD